MIDSYIDLHCHSTYSDGTYTPQELLALAEAAGLRALALTDHDTVSGLPEFFAAAKETSLLPIAGIELSSLYQEKTEIHILGLWIDYQNDALLNSLQRMQQKRIARNRQMIKALAALGFSISEAELFALAKGGVVTRAHFAALLEQKGYVKSKTEAFEKLLSPGKPAYVKKEAPSCADCVQLIKKAGGTPILAHPTLYHMNYRQLTLLCQELIPAGLVGIETMYSSYRHEQERELTKLANKLSLYPSGGSDFHGKNKPYIRIGVGHGNLRIPFSFLEGLHPESGQ